MIEDLLNVNTIRVITLLITLTYASVLDYKTRIVPDKIWYAPVSIGFLIVGYEMYVGDPFQVALYTAISFSTIFILSFVLLKSRIFYEADHKAFATIAILVPQTPTGIYPIYRIPNKVDMVTIINIVESGVEFTNLINYLLSYTFLNVFGFSVFINASILSILFFITNIIHNLKNDNFNYKRPLRTISARKIPLKQITSEKAIIIDTVESQKFFKRGFEYIKNGLYGHSTMFYQAYIEWYRNQNKNDPNTKITDINEIKLKDFIEDKDDWLTDNIDKDKKFAEKFLQKEELWVTLSTPFIVVITLGTFFSVLIGNIGYIIISLLI